MKSFVIYAFFAFSGSVLACGNIPSQIENNYINAEVISRSHMDLELVINLKSTASENIRVYGGLKYNTETLPACGSSKTTSLKWDNLQTATHWTSWPNNFTSTYRICIYNDQGKLKSSYEICNSEVGD